MGYFALLALLCLGCGLGASSYKPHEWTMLILTHHWPQTFCIMQSCKTDIDNWTLHGLWPDKGHMCNSSWVFNASLIEDLLPEMRKSWPDLLHPSPSTVFWEHEWKTHGTCAVHSDALNTEHKYFNKALELYHKLGLNSALRNHSIVPSETYYMLDDIEGAIYDFYKVKPKIQCTHALKGEQTLGQIEICFDKEFTLIDCHHPVEEDTWNNPNNILTTGGSTGFSVCDRNVKVFYPPLKEKQ
ncbi:hypothetical protein AAFF_G00215170 [Aldrovandia affinis]|uniref:Uncharacterized protein n=1 Tax=Aldrovandia affinis TaxID=143900 RepID=A0AAD7W534_9TELE|nr:hypothetical protein AAFF_G00215170 [Aldrovandia affinis]